MPDWAAALKPASLRVLEALVEEPLSLTALSARLALTKPSLQRHLGVLVDLGLLAKEEVRTPVGREMRFRLREASLHLETRPRAKAILSWATAGLVDPRFPLTAQVPQPEMRTEVANALAHVARAYGEGFLRDVSLAIVFGSVARGEATWKSDIDLVVVGGNGKNVKGRLQDAIADAQAALTHPLRAHLVERADLLAARKTVVREALEEGIVVLCREEDDELWGRMRRYKRTWI